MIAVDSTDGKPVDLPVERSLDELQQLVFAAGDEVVGRVTQQLPHPHPVSYVGKGKLNEIAVLRQTLHFDVVVADDELSPNQQRFLEDELDMEIADRTAVILHLFSMHARSREGSLQVELAQNRYRLPRLTGRGVELSRLGAGINTRGPGETKLETDRRRIRTRITMLTKSIDEVARQRSLHRRQRGEANLPVVALVGYTNAGKSTLMNALTNADVLSSQAMFATLDPTTRQLALPNDLHVLLTDTVGFIQKLPADLVAAFRATLEEIQHASCIAHVIDVSHPGLPAATTAVENELTSLGIHDRPRISILNKIDLIPQSQLPLLRKRFPNPVPVSAATGTGLPALRRRMALLVGSLFVPVKVQIPYLAAGDVHLFHQHGMIEREDHRANGTLIIGKLPPALLSRFEQYM